MTTATSSATRASTLIVVAAIAAGALLGTFAIANTSIGWHLASGRWILAERSVPTTDPFAFTTGGATWIDHEWLFQVTVAAIEAAGGATALTFARAAVVAALSALLLLIGIRSGLPPPAALLLAVACVAGARPRFFLRPELVTLLFVPAVVALFMHRRQLRTILWLPVVTALTIVNANAHGAAVVVPVLLAGVMAAEVLQMLARKRWDARRAATGALGVAAAAAALLANPYGWRLLTVPFHLAELVDQPHIPNPEWISPTPVQAPWLYFAVIAAGVVLAARERRLGRWALFVMASALAFRHIRNLGLFFALLPIAVAPALATWNAVIARSGNGRGRSRIEILAVTAALVLALSLAASPHRHLALGWAEDYYPDRACEFMERERLPTGRLYNDVRFGGYLIGRHGPTRPVFIDDRNELHDGLLREIWDIMRRSDVEAWSRLMRRWELDTALVRYHAPIEVTTPDGRPLGRRGFSALWFPVDEWALVFWDDVAMVLVRRDTASARLLARHEYTTLRPDDLAHLERRLVSDPRLAPAVAEEAARAQRADPDNEIAAAILRRLVGAE